MSISTTKQGGANESRLISGSNILSLRTLCNNDSCCFSLLCFPLLWVASIHSGGNNINFE